MGTLAGLMLARITVALKRSATVYGLLAAGCLVAFFGAAYALDAARAALAMRYGPVTASLLVAAGLCMAAAVAVGAGLYLRRQPINFDPAKSSPYSTPPHALPYSAQRLVAIASAGAGAICAGLAIYKVPALRALLRRRRGPDAKSLKGAGRDLAK